VPQRTAIEYAQSGAEGGSCADHARSRAGIIAAHHEIAIEASLEVGQRISGDGLERSHQRDARRQSRSQMLTPRRLRQFDQGHAAGFKAQRHGGPGVARDNALQSIGCDADDLIAVGQGVDGLAAATAAICACVNPIQ